MKKKEHTASLYNNALHRCLIFFSRVCNMFIPKREWLFIFFFPGVFLFNCINVPDPFISGAYFNVITFVDAALNILKGEKKASSQFFCETPQRQPLRARGFDNSSQVPLKKSYTKQTRLELGRELGKCQFRVL